MVHGRLSDAQAVVLAAAGPEAVRLALLAANARIAQLQTPAISPSTPSGMIPVYQKPPAPWRKKKPGAKPGDVFDPATMQAIMQQPTNQYPENHMTQSLQNGYSHYARSLRPAQVAVSKAQ